MAIEFNEGAWEIAIAAPSRAALGSRGVGATFNAAWGAMAPTWA